MAENDKAKGKKQVPLRLSASLYDELARWAEDDFRSINGQIEYLLTECVKKRKKAAPKRAVNYPPGEAPELNEPFTFEFSSTLSRSPLSNSQRERNSSAYSP